MNEEMKLNEKKGKINGLYNVYYRYVHTVHMNVRMYVCTFACLHVFIIKASG